jgi:hypothetical protein
MVMGKDDQMNQLNLTVVALVALVAIVGLVALVMNAASISKVSTGSGLVSAENIAGDSKQANPGVVADDPMNLNGDIKRKVRHEDI